MKSKLQSCPPLVKSILLTDRLSIEEILTVPGKIHTFLNPVSYLTALKQERLYAGFDSVMVDGSVLAISIRLFYGRKVRRRSFDMTSIASRLFQHILSEGKRVYLAGARQEEIEKAVKILSGQYPGIQIAGYRNGYFSSKDEILKECENIIRLSPDYVIVGMGAPMQERFLSTLKDAGYQGIGFTCGGFFSQLSMKGVQYYPQWMDKYNLRFLYRFYKEKHTRERYLKTALVFPFYFIKDKCFKR